MPGREAQNWLIRVLIFSLCSARRIFFCSHVFHSISRERLERYIFDEVEVLFLQLVHEWVKAYDVPEETKKDIASLCCYAVLGFIIKFLWTNMNVDVDTSVDRLMESFSGGFDYFIQQAVKQAGKE